MDHVAKIGKKTHFGVAEPVFYSCARLMSSQVVQIFFTHLSHHRYEGFESEVQSQNLSRFGETEALKTPQNSLEIHIAFLFSLNRNLTKIILKHGNCVGYKGIFQHLWSD